MNPDEVRKIVSFLYEVGTLRSIPRAHGQTLFTGDLSDNIASHSFRVTIIGLHLALLEKADPFKVIVMCLFHDVPEVRSGDHNWIHKKYVKVFTDEVVSDQWANHPLSSFLLPIIKGYEERVSLESLVAKDADLLDQNLLLREHELRGSEEAKRWVELRKEHPAKRLATESAKRLSEEILHQTPSDWWKGIYTSVNR